MYYVLSPSFINAGNPHDAQGEENALLETMTLLTGIWNVNLARLLQYSTVQFERGKLSLGYY
jgi:hypothetical protein